MGNHLKSSISPPDLMKHAGCRLIDTQLCTPVSPCGEYLGFTTFLLFHYLDFLLKYFIMIKNILLPFCLLEIGCY